jgi:hypothetical protein
MVLNLLAACLMVLLLAGRSNLEPGDKFEQYRFFTRSIEFDYVTWTLDALFVKTSQLSLNTTQYLNDPQQSSAVLKYIGLVSEMNYYKAQIKRFYADPNITNPHAATFTYRKRLDELTSLRQHLGPFGETILQDQVSRILKQLGFDVAGESIPPVLYHVSDLPNALIISPRSTIRQVANISLLPDLSIGEIIDLEIQMEKSLDVSTLVTPIGGIGTYPTMVMSTDNITFMTDVIAHEWIHNYLTLHPLGINYETTPEVRTMNETSASIAGKEIGGLVIQEYYPEYSPKIYEPQNQQSQIVPQDDNTPVLFDFNKEMHKTRVTVDRLLAENKVDEAERYMETQRIIFWQNGYEIRRLNQAYFAFYGAYADETEGGASGEDPVGPAVRKLRAQSASLKDFMDTIAQMTSFSQLKNAVGLP